MANISRKTFIVLSLLAITTLLWSEGKSSLPSRTVKSGKQASKRITESVERQVKLVDYSEGSLLIEWECPEPQIVRNAENGEVSAIRMKGLMPLYETGVPELPVAGELLDCLPGPVSFQIIDSEFESEELGTVQPTPEDYLVDLRPEDDFVPDDQAKSFAERVAETPKKAGLWPEQVVTLTEAGVYRGHRLVALNIHPVRVDARSGRAQILKRITLRVTLPREQTVGERAADDVEETRLLKSLLGEMAPTAQLTRAAEQTIPRSESNPVLDAPADNRYRIIVNEDNVFRVTGEDLLFAELPYWEIDPIDLHLWNKGEEVPFFLVGGLDGHFDEEDYFEFFGERNTRTMLHIDSSIYEDPYSQDNVYWMTWGDGRPGIRLGVEDGSWHPTWTATDLDRVRTKQHFEKDNYLTRLSQTSRIAAPQLQTGGPLSIYRDYWFWEERIDAFSSREYAVSLIHPFVSLGGIGTATVIRACLNGFSWGIGNSDHHRAVVSINGLTERGLSVGKVSASDNNTVWRGQSSTIIESDLSNTDPVHPYIPNITSAALFHGPNVIRVDCPGDGLAGTDDKILVNWFEVEYDRAPRASQDFIRFTFDKARGDTFALDIRGFSSRDIQVWKLGQSRLTNMNIRRVTPVDESASWAAQFHLISNDAYDMIVFSDHHVKPPLMIVKDSTDIDLRNQTGARYLLITHDSFLSDPSLMRLDSLRRASFFGSVLTVPVSEIYEQFSDGLETPLAIRDFLKYAYEHWPIRPTHACLVGDAILRQRNGHPSGNLISSLFAQTLDFGIAASDMLFGCVSGPDWDIIPDIAVGRISCRTPQQLETYVEKVYEYEKNPDFEGLFQSQVLMIADKNDFDFDFVTDFSESTLRLMSPDANISRVYLDSITTGQGFARLRDALSNGSVIANYNGHGGGGVWSGTELINTEGVGLLIGQSTYPLITNFTCYVGAFDEQNNNAVLGEIFLFARNSITNDLVGATGFYSSSGVGWAAAGNSMQKSLFQFILDRPARTYGEIVQLNKTRFWSSIGQSISFNSNYSMMMMMNLLGDPGIKLALPREDLSPGLAEPSNVVEHGQTVHVSAELPWIPESGEPTFVYALPYNGDIIDTIEHRPGHGNRVVSPYVATTRSPAFDRTRVIPNFVYTQQFDSLSLEITSRFVTPQGRVVVYATDPFNSRSAIGSFPIFLRDSLLTVRIYDVHTWPSDIILSDSVFQIRATIMHENDMSSVYMRGIFRPAQGPVVLDTMYLSEVEPGLWASDYLGPYHMQGGQYRVKFFAQPFGAEMYESELFDIRAQSSLDFSANPSLEVPRGERSGKQPLYYLPLESTGNIYSAPVTELPIRLTGVSADTTIRTIVEADSTYLDTTITLQDSFVVDMTLTDLNFFQRYFEAFIPTRFRPLPYALTIKLDPDNVIEESNEGNNVFKVFIDQPVMYPATSGLGTYYPATAVHSASVGPHRFWEPGKLDTFFMHIPPGQLPIDSATIVYYAPREIADAELTTLGKTGLYRTFPALSGSSNQPVAFRATLQDTSEGLGAESQVNVQLLAMMYDSLGSSRSSAEFGLFQKHANRDSWWRLSGSEVTLEPYDTVFVITAIDPGDFDTTRVLRVQYRMVGSGSTNHLGEFAIFRSVDEQGPSVDISVGGLLFTQNSILPSKPEIYATIADPIGVDRSPGKCYLILDGDTIPEWQITWSDTLDWGGTTSALIRPEIEPGEHHFEVFATDNVGNMSIHGVDFVTRGDFGIEWALNYPNPFSKTTTIAYVLTGATDDYVEIKIFTVSGRLIRTIRDVVRETANYRSLVWDGRDSFGDEVANGVYFARIKATRDEQTVEKTVKLAKVR
ncbi:T9SS type A sorting domain-containing protein [bacterium]|nr:T9SS type A sorting domain-containing protein [bacterium]